jgi:hypothetical protein
MALCRPPVLAPLTCAALAFAALACGAEPTTALDADAGAAAVDASTARPDAGDARPDVGPIGVRRLALQTVNSTDGRLKGAVRLYDRRLDSPCAPVAAPGVDGARLCGPTTFAFITYLDDRCTTPFVASRTPPGAVVLGYDVGAPSRAVRVGPAVTPTPTQRWMSQPRGGCEPLDPGAAEAQGAVFAIAESWTDEELPQGQLVTDDADRWVRVQRFVSDEGLSVVLGLFDKASGAACRPGATPAGDRCVPDLDGIDRPLELDATCTRPVVIQYGSPRVAQVPGRDEYLRFDSDGMNAQEVEVGRLVGGRCVVERRHTGRMTYSVGTPYPPSDWPRLQRTAMRSSDGLTQLVVTLSSGAALGPSLGLEPGVGLVDGLSADGSSCGPTWVDGVLRCLPGSAQSPDLYADGRCSISAAWQVPSGARGARMLLEDGDARTAWLPRGELRAVTAREAGPRFVLGSQGCVSWGDGERVVLGERLSARDLPALVVQLD